MKGELIAIIDVQIDSLNINRPCEIRISHLKNNIFALSEGKDKDVHILCLRKHPHSSYYFAALIDISSIDGGQNKRYEEFELLSLSYEKNDQEREMINIDEFYVRS